MHESRGTGGSPDGRKSSGRKSSGRKSSFRKGTGRKGSGSGTASSGTAGSGRGGRAFRVTGISANGADAWRLFEVIAAWWLSAPAVYGLGWCLRFVTPGHRFAQSADQWFYANFLSFAAGLWIWLVIGFAGSAFIARAALARAMSGQWVMRATGIVAVVLAFASFLQLCRVAWDNDKDFARYYARATVFYAPALSGPDAPPSLDRLLTGARPGGAGSRCDLVGAADVPSCVVRATLPATGWQPRVSSYSGAVFALSRSSGDMQNVSLNAATVHYLNSWHGHPARWSGIMDGSGISQGMGGVAEWDGAHVTTCDFSGRYAIDRSFGGRNMADMADFLAQSYPGLRWTITDVWGYCDGSEPVVVVPVTKMIRYQNRTVNTAAGIIIVRGASGKTSLAYEPDVRAGALPGPVYPASLVDTQLAQSAWAAGRGAMNNGGFGYEPTNAAVQAGNVSDFLLRTAKTGRLQWVTPLTLRDSSSQLFVAYAISTADTVTNGRLNQLSIYVLSPSDPRQINVDNMEAEARNWLAQQDPGFISSGGQLVEFTPVGGNRWRAYGEVNGRVVYLLDVDATGTVAPQLTSVSPLGGAAGGGTAGGGVSGGTGSGTGTAVCGKPLSSLTTAQLAFCVREFANEIATRAG